MSISLYDVREDHILNKRMCSRVVVDKYKWLVHIVTSQGKSFFTASFPRA